MVSMEAYGFIGIMNSYFPLRVEAVDKTSAGELRLVWWRLVEAAYHVLESVGDVDDARKGSIEVLC